MTQIHGTWYAYSTNKQKKSKNPTPSCREGALVLNHTLVGPCYCDDFIYVISVPCGECTQNGDVASTVLMYGMWFEH